MALLKADFWYTLCFSSGLFARNIRVPASRKLGFHSLGKLSKHDNANGQCFCSDVSKDSGSQQSSQARAKTKSPSSTISKRDRVFKQLVTIIRKGKIERVPKGSWICMAYTTSESYNIELLKNYFNNKSSTFKVAALPKDSPDVLRVLQNGKEGLEDREIFFFRRLGAFVCWNLPEIEMMKLRHMLKDFQLKPYAEDLSERENEQLSYFYKDSIPNLVGGDIFLSKEGNHETKALEKYAFSNAMALSVKLAIWESALDQFVDSLKDIPEDLQHGLKPNMSRKQVLQKLGELLSLRHQINLYSDLLMTPDFYWDREDLELLYNKTCNYLDVGRRTKVTNEKLNLCSEMVEILRNDLNEQHSLRLEWAIIALIAVEVIFEIGHWVEKFHPF